MPVKTEPERELQAETQPMPVLLCVLPQEPAGTPRSWSVIPGMQIGREVDPGRDIKLTADKKVSHRHAQIVIEGRRVFIKDLGSTNHTFVNGKQIAAVELRDGDVIRTGGTLIVMRYRSASERDAPMEDIEITSRLLGNSEGICVLRHELSQVARSSAPVLLLAATGTGKELAAEAIHYQSGRRRDGLSTLNTTAVTSNLVEKELFGNVRGAYSDAREEFKGRFEQADGGSLFLDEIGEIPLEVQAKLLRALQPTHHVPIRHDGQPTQYPIRIRPVGGKSDVEVNVRIIAATNVDIARAVAEGRFREDLYQRLQTLTVRLPSLVERREDILWLLHHYLNLGRPADDFRTVTARLAELLLLYSWPGNVRQLISMTERLRVRAPNAKTLDLGDLHPDDLKLFREAAAAHVGPPAAKLGSSLSAPREPAPTEQPQEITHELMERLLAETQGNISKIARLLQRSPRQIRRRLEEFGLRKKSSPVPESVTSKPQVRISTGKPPRDEDVG